MFSHTGYMCHLPHKMLFQANRLELNLYHRKIVITENSNNIEIIY